MRALWALTVANIRSYMRDRAALFWTLAFPLIFIFLFGFIFEGGGDVSTQVGWGDEDGTAAPTGPRAAFAVQPGAELTDLERDPAVAQMQDGDLDTVLVVPAGYGAAVAAAAGGRGAPASILGYLE